MFIIQNNLTIAVISIPTAFSAIVEALAKLIRTSDSMDLAIVGTG